MERSGFYMHHWASVTNPLHTFANRGVLWPRSLFSALDFNQREQTTNDMIKYVLNLSFLQPESHTIRRGRNRVRISIAHNLLCLNSLSWHTIQIVFVWSTGESNSHSYSIIFVWLWIWRFVNAPTWPYVNYCFYK